MYTKYTTLFILVVSLLLYVIVVAVVFWLLFFCMLLFLHLEVNSFTVTNVLTVIPTPEHVRGRDLYRTEPCQTPESGFSREKDTHSKGKQKKIKHQLIYNVLSVLCYQLLNTTSCEERVWSTEFIVKYIHNQVKGNGSRIII